VQTTTIPVISKDAVIDLALDTLAKKKQALVFVNTKRSAEKEAESIAAKVSKTQQALAEQIRSVLPHPTKQCERLAKCVAHGIAFHHAGLHAKQRHFVEDGFRDGRVSIICCTPTLAAGLDLPAFRVIIRDVKRYGNYGMDYIPVLEYHQMAGRAGRPSYDTYGEAIAIAKTEPEADHILDEYVNGMPENILSKLAVEPVLRTYVLSLVATHMAHTEQELLDFFSKTFWAHQFGDLEKLQRIISDTVLLLQEIGMLQGAQATRLGQRVAQLYIDPLSAHTLRTNLKPGMQPLKQLYMLCTCTEMKPLFRMREKEFTDIETEGVSSELDEYFEEDYYNTLKTACVLNDYINEKDEANILERRNIAPGELHGKLERANWLCYAASEIAKITTQKELHRALFKLRMRLRYGVQEELLNLIRFKGIGRIRARKLFNQGIRGVADVKKAAFSELNNILGHKIATELKAQVGERIKASPQRHRNHSAF